MLPLLRRLLPLLIAALLMAPDLPANAVVNVRLQTVLGDVDLALDDVAAPAYVDNFLLYTESREWDGLFVHRSVPGFVIQAGAWRFDGAALTAVANFGSVPGSPPTSNVKYTIAMALSNNDPNSGTNQWFINMADNPSLDPTFTVFGEVTAGEAVLDAINALPFYDLSGLIPFATSVPLINFQGLPLVLGHFVRMPRVVVVADDQCGDVNDDLVVDDLDPGRLRDALADPVGQGLSLAGADKCPVIAGAPACSIRDWVVMTRDLARLGPGMQDSCPAAGL